MARARAAAEQVAAQKAADEAQAKSAAEAQARAAAEAQAWAATEAQARAATPSVADDLMRLKEQARKIEEELRQMGTATVSKPPGHTAIPLPVKVMSKMSLDLGLCARPSYTQAL